MSDRVGDRAVVLGGSMAGLLAARVLAEAYSDVSVVERDTVTGVTSTRRGVPQGRHVHGLLARGQQILEELFPGFTEDAIAAGIPTGDFGELRWYFNGVRLRPATTGLTCVSAARPVLEHHVRQRVHDLPNVTFVERTDIVGLVTDAHHARVTGVRVRRQEEDSDEVLDADLVVDATGRGSRTPTWLAEFGYAPPDEERIKVDMGYTTRHFRLPDESVLNGDLSINPVSTPATPRGGFFSRINDGRCVVSLTGVLGDHAPTDPDGFLAYAESLPVPDIHEVIREAEPLDDAVFFRYPASVRRRYERLDRFPERLVVVGDASCSFNPVYAQGMTVAAIQALTLRGHLREGVPQPRRFHRDVAKVLDVPWDVAASGDLGYPGVEGRRTLKVRVSNTFMAKTQAAAARDGAVTRALMRVAGLVDPPQELMRPRMLLRVLRNAGPPPRVDPPQPPERGRDGAGTHHAA